MPHGRIGVAWAAVTAVATVLGPLVVGVWMALHAALAAVQALRTHGRPPDPMVAGSAGVFGFACGFGWWGALGGLVVAVAAGQVRRTPLPVVPVVLGAAAGSLPLARTIGAVPALFLLALMCAHDTGNYLVGTGANAAWEGEAAGVAAMGPVTLLAATVAVPPFTDWGPWILGGLAAVVTPAGPYAGSALLGERRRGVQLHALRRLDALILLGPVWVTAAAFLRR